MHHLEKNIFRLSVRELVEFLYRSGDLDNRRGGKKEQSMLAGTRIHQKIQRRQPATYRPEVPFALTVPVYLGQEEPAYFIAIEGRADGIFDDGLLLGVDEIKGVYKPLAAIHEPQAVHLAQAKCYAYMATREEPRDVMIQMTYVNLDSEEEKYFRQPFTYQEITDWFEEMIAEYQKWCTFSWNHRQARNASAQSLAFPYDYRPGQKALVATAYRFLRDRKTLYLQASTGIGKTLSTMYPAVRIMGEERVERIFYLTAKTITATVAKEAMEIMEEHGLAASYLHLTAKEKLCFQEEVNCNPVDCPYAKGHLDRVNAAVYDLITTCTRVTREDIWAFAEKHQVCPFELSLDVSYWVDVIICDYNYAFDPNVRLQRFFGGEANCDGLFLIDEAHNLVDRAREMISATVYKTDFLAAKRVIEPFSKPVAKAIERCNRDLLALKRECDGFTPYEDPETFLLLADHIQRFMEEYARFTENSPQFYDKDFLNFYFECRDFLNIYPNIGNGYTMYGRLSEGEDYSLTLANVDPSEHLRLCLEQGKGAIMFSATLLPIRYYRSLLTGEQGENAIYAESPFDTSKRLLLVAGDVTSRYARRGKEQYERIAAYIRTIVEAKEGHYMVFFPSFAFMEQVIQNLGDVAYPWVAQGQSMNEEEREAFLKRFGQEETETLVGFCVIGGIFSEGIDLKGESLIGVIVVGCGLPGVSEERNLLRDYFTEKGQDGFAYAYLYPGMGKVLQAAGRLIRTDTDRGVIALLDDRFSKAEYRRLFPREWADARWVRLPDVAPAVEAFWTKTEEN